MLHVTGTEFFEPIDDEDFNKTKEFWDQHLVSESPHVYRAEYLAATILFEAERGEGELGIQELHEAHLQKEGLAPIIRRYIEARYDEGYERGVHDADVELIMDKAIGMYLTAGLLRFSPAARALATLFWTFEGQKKYGPLWARRAQSFGRLRESLEHHGPLRRLGSEFASTIEAFGLELGLLGDQKSEHLSREAGHYLAEELVNRDPHFIVSEDASSLRNAFLERLDQDHTQLEFREDLERLDGTLPARWELVTGWMSGFVARHKDDHPAWERTLPEAVALLMTEDDTPHQVSSARVSADIKGLLGQHRRVDNQVMHIHLDEFLTRLRHYIEFQVPRYREFRRLSHEVLARERRRLRLDELKPRVLSTFVRNRLIDEVYLPLIGNNLAKQLGAVGDEGRSDRSGLLLLISPPGYGKTTLMEYIASRLGLVFMSINGPSLGHNVTSLDPAEAPNATARQEVEKVNLALEMGNNVLLYLDDIQHTDSEFLQKFISLCDATRRIEGVYKGNTRTYDMRGKRFAVVMAGNPYNEAGERFRIPDMLANRADTYNLGDILDGRGDVFALSYIENALTSNRVLAPLATRDRADLDRFIRMAGGETIPLTEMVHDYSSAEAGEIVGVFKRLLVVQKVLLMVNQAYIASASQDDRYRTEPGFQLQGSYRNMARLTERVVAAMNDDELQALIDDHYVGESQTLTTGSEHNLLKLAEMRGRMTDEEKERWENIKREFVRRNMMGGDDDPISRVAGPLSGLVQKLDDVHGTLKGERLAGEVGEMRSALVELLESMNKAAAQARFDTRYVRSPLEEEQK
ncbi:MAG: AAA family ATPase, partial [Bradymonadaceae bacterium]